MADQKPPARLDRRAFLGRSAAASGALLAGSILARTPLAGAVSPAGPSSTPSLPVLGANRVRSGRPLLANGIQAGDVSGDAAVLWARSDRSARLLVDWSTTYTMDDAQPLPPLAVGPDTDFTGKLVVSGLPQGQRVFYRVVVEDLVDPSLRSAPEIGSFATPPAGDEDVSFAFTGDCAGQGWGINPEWGGMRCFETIRRQEPDFFLHSGDTIYADGPLLPEVELPDGTIWHNLVTPEKSKVCETLDEYRGAFRYNLLDENVRRLNAEVPILTQWDDHEVLNNWYPGEVVNLPAYQIENRVDVLAARARQAFFEYFPIRPGCDETGRVYRKISYGPNLDVFMLDMRQYRGPNSPNLQTEPGPDTAFLGATQVAWLKEGLRASTATWKVIAADMPIGVHVPDGTDGNNPNFPGGQGPGWWEAVANGDGGPPKGRELEMADLLSAIKRMGIRNVVWFTADVHYTAAHYYDPAEAVFTDFDPFWEFVGGPVNAGTFGPNPLDPTFGPQLKFVKAPPEGPANLAPSAGYQFFGVATLDGATKALTVKLMDVAGATLYEVELPPAD